MTRILILSIITFLFFHSFLYDALAVYYTVRSVLATVTLANMVTVTSHRKMV